MVNFGLTCYLPNHFFSQVQNKLLSMINSDYEQSTIEAPSLVFCMKTLKHLCRLKIRDVLKNKDERHKTTQEYLTMIKSLPLPPVMQNYLRYI